MKNFKLIAGINLAVLFIYTVLVRLIPMSGDNQGLGIVIISCFLIFFHVVINGIISIVYYSQSENQLGNSYMLTAAMVAVIGFATCTIVP
jgi:hypothetical protein